PVALGHVMDHNQFLDDPYEDDEQSYDADSEVLREVILNLGKKTMLQRKVSELSL
ncbi:hypothetical protein A2U01_0102558, partial [Trifolium medium]|nr:hypothetical protein [Trifolium medium]